MNIFLNNQIQRNQTLLDIMFGRKVQNTKYKNFQEDKVMAISGIGSNYNHMGASINFVQGKATVKEANSKTAEQPVNLSISNEGRNMLREMVSKFEPDSDYTNVRELTIQNTNEVAWEHYTEMRGISSLTLKEGNYNVEDVMKSIMDTYESRYNEIVKEHENGDREVSYELTGKRSLTLDEDLAGLDEAYKMRLANLAGYITCQQTNKEFENPDSSWYFHRNGSQNEGKTQDRVQLFDTEYRDSAASIMDQAREKFLTASKSSGYKKGAATGILSDILNENTNFVANTQKLFS